jgi:2-(1,2-epoxy-1,2-dihydrophenyl)acetyl-CoA isomerase
VSLAFEHITYAVDAGVATLTLNMPARMNALSAPLQREVMRALDRVAQDTGVRALRLTGAGRAFSVGADLGGFGPDEGRGRSLGQRTADEMQALANPMILAVRALPVPVVVALNGAAAGAGAGLALAADVVIAARSAYFYLPFVPKLGIVPDLGITWFLPRLIGRSRAMALSLLGERLSAEQAAQWGVVWACVDDAVLDAESMSLARQLAALPAHGVAEARAAYDHSERSNLAEQLNYESSRQRELLDRATFAEGVQAFMQKREPRFPGR